jgi:hypothetical protein
MASRDAYCLVCEWPDAANATMPHRDVPRELLSIGAGYLHLFVLLAWPTHASCLEEIRQTTNRRHLYPSAVAPLLHRMSGLARLFLQ